MEKSPRIALIREEEEEEQEEDDIPADSLWAYYGENEAGEEEMPIAFVYFEGTYTGTSPDLSIFPSWAFLPSDETFQSLRSLSFEAFWDLEGQRRLVLVANHMAAKLRVEVEE